MVMAGGAGTRLWPLSRRHRPKQLIRFIRGGDRPRSLLELAMARLDGLIPPERRYVCAGLDQREAMLRELPGLSEERFLGEPVGRDTANAIGLTAAVLSLRDPEAVFAVLTADHVIEPVDVFQQRLERGFALVEAWPQRLVTFSIRPTRPATEYGYVEWGEAIYDASGSAEGTGEPFAYLVDRFVEKPDRERAEAYVQSGRFGWNSGMFVFRAEQYLRCLERFLPDSYEGLMAVRSAWGTPRRAEVLERVYGALPRISVDYAVMEPAAGSPDVPVLTVEMPLRWLDVGSWPSYGQTLPADARGNRLAGEGAAVVHAGTDNLVYVEGADHTVALLGVDGLVVVHTPDATLVMPAERAQDLKDLHARLPERLR